MKILSATQIRETDTFTIANEPIKSLDLMERAATACYNWIISKFDKSSSFKIFCGVGNNGGDGLVIARKLFENDFDTEVFIVPFSENFSPDFSLNLERLKNLAGIKVSEISSQSLGHLPKTPKQIFIDAIFGSGLSKPITGLAGELIKEINERRKNNPSNKTVSIDIASGLFCDDISENSSEKIIKPDYTLSFELPKLSFLLPGNSEYVGNWKIIPIGLDKKFISSIPSKKNFITQADAKNILKPRPKFSHKGTFGHALLISGSYGKAGASVLSAKGCLHSGAGLVTAYIPKCAYEILQTAVPEAMVNVDESEMIICNLPPIEKYSSIGIGPGIGMDIGTQKILKLLIQNARVPLVIDADAINILGENKTWLSFLPPKSILTPHPGEFERIAGKTGNDFEKMTKQIELAIKNNIYVVLKGAHTCIACPDGEVFFNSTGNPGMATGGSGDVLTGIITGLLSQGYSPKESAILGVYIHGLAGDIGAQDNGYEALLASDICKYIGRAFLSLYP